MQRSSTTLVLLAGVGLGVLVSLLNSPPTAVRAASGDRYENYVICTGAVSVNPRLQTDGVWLLDYRSGKLLGTVIDKSQGRIVGWSEVDLISEFQMVPKSDVHFMMVTGYITQGQAALYVAETTTGKFGVYTMGPGAGGDTVTIRRHDMTSFRNVVPPSGVQPAQNAVTQPVPFGPIPGLGQPPAMLPPAIPNGPGNTVPANPTSTITPPIVPGSGTPPPLTIPK